MPARFFIDYQNQNDWLPLAGTLQSPINIDTSLAETVTAREASSIKLFFDSNQRSFFNNGQNLQLLCHGKARLNGRRFSLVQLHFHAESEHTIDQQQFPLEGHFLYRAANGQTAVVAVLYTIGRHNSAFEQVLQQFANENAEGECALDTLLPMDKSYYHYLGSLTTPPLTENVEWYVLQQTMSVSAEQVAKFEKIHGKNCRNLQPLNDRSVLHFAEK
ncbi:carbonic anhydrase family protein [Enterococcus sp. 669A]|uniref:Carbonic anhydrase n=1 Tax=Candidatus Enterococcus moelleringii TaxID=2815325 RepID=A0ABS3LC39_9ENTE|nr:carbonic anhydrase family protein [Enterococcus sp. 669A]